MGYHWIRLNQTNSDLVFLDIFNPRGRQRWRKQPPKYVFWALIMRLLESKWLHGKSLEASCRGCLKFSTLCQYPSIFLDQTIVHILLCAFLDIRGLKIRGNYPKYIWFLVLFSIFQFSILAVGREKSVSQICEGKNPSPYPSVRMRGLSLEQSPRLWMVWGNSWGILWWPASLLAHDFPPAGSDLRRHGKKEMSVNEQHLTPPQEGKGSTPR